MSVRLKIADRTATENGYVYRCDVLRGAPSWLAIMGGQFWAALDIEDDDALEVGDIVTVEHLMPSMLLATGTKKWLPKEEG